MRVFAVCVNVWGRLWGVGCVAKHRLGGMFYSELCNST